MLVCTATYELAAAEAEGNWKEPDDEAGWEQVDVGWKEAGWQDDGSAHIAEHHDDHQAVHLDADGYDEHGGYYDEEGGYYDADGGYYDKDGTFFEPEGFDVPATPTKVASAGSAASTPKSGLNPFSKILRSP